MGVAVENLEDLKKKVDQIEHDLIEVRKNLDQITFAVSPKIEVDLCSKLQLVYERLQKRVADNSEVLKGLDSVKLVRETRNSR